MLPIFWKTFRVWLLFQRLYSIFIFIKLLHSVGHIISIILIKFTLSVVNPCQQLALKVAFVVTIRTSLWVLNELELHSFATNYKWPFHECLYEEDRTFLHLFLNYLFSNADIFTPLRFIYWLILNLVSIHIISNLKRKSYSVI